LERNLSSPPLAKKDPSSWPPLGWRWEYYHALLELVPDDLVVDEVLIGLHWTLVRSGDRVGMSMTYREGEVSVPQAGDFAGKPLREVARLVLSWNFVEAAIGVAAIGAGVNTRERVESLLGHPLEVYDPENAFDALREKLRGKKVAVVGHFPGIEELREDVELTIFERVPLPGDTPDPAAEYLMAEQDAVFLTASTLVNKTFPRMLELAREKFLVLVGPSTPMHPLLYTWGVDVLAGLFVLDPDRVWHIAQEGGHRRLFQEGAFRVNVPRHGGGL